MFGIATEPAHYLATGKSVLSGGRWFRGAGSRYTVVMAIDVASLGWVGILVGVIAGQVVSTVWFVVLFGEPWAREYGAADKAQHTKEVPPYTYGVGLACTLALTLTIALLQQALSITTMGAALQLGVLLSLGLCIATLLPGQAFLRRYRVALIAGGSQVAMILTISVVLVLLAYRRRGYEPPARDAGLRRPSSTTSQLREG